MIAEAVASDPQPDANPREDQDGLQKAMEHLDALHVQLRDLRSTIPSIVRSLTTPASSPEKLFQAYARAIAEASSDVKDFTTSMQSQETCAMFDRAAASKRARPSGVKPWLVVEHADWCQPKPSADSSEAANGDKSNSSSRDANEDDAEEDEDGGSDEVVDLDTTGQLVAKWRAANPGARARFDEGTGLIKLTLPPPAHLQFDIAKAPDGRGKKIYVVQCKNPSKLAEGIQKCISSRKRPSDLRFLLDMIAAYADVMTRPCDKCGMLLGKRPQLTTLRKKVRRGNLRKSEDRGAKSESVWAAYHVGCR